jgi:hypothetical protein
MKSRFSNPVRAALRSLLATAVLGASPVFAASAAPLPTTGYDWTLLVVLAFGVTGLVWIRRHITRL